MQIINATPIHPMMYEWGGEEELVVVLLLSVEGVGTVVVLRLRCRTILIGHLIPCS